MNPQRWDQVARIYELAVDLDPAARAVILDEVCAGDPDLRHEVETLLVEEQSGGLIDRPVWDAAVLLLEEAPVLVSGSVFGSYRVEHLLGTGGMGEVYRARDVTLNRDVALKVLPRSFVHDADRLARLRREAQVLASLNHPNIAGIHGFEEVGGVGALVLELIDGSTLADRIAGGPLPLDEALPIAGQIAEALQAAHAQGVIHRDLKPANIKLRPDGTVKVLDFGLAKALAMASPHASPLAAGRSSTLSPAATAAGMIMGTAAYMSPEQARGAPLDRRSDIWAYGCVVYEMLTGRRAFPEPEVADVLAAVLTRDSDLAALPVTTPPSIRRLLRRCLQKDRDERLHDLGDARLELRDAGSRVDPDVDAAAPPQPERWWRIAAIIATAFAAAIGASLVVIDLLPGAAAPEIRFEIHTPPSSEPASLAIAPDARAIVFAADSPDRPRLWLQRFDSVVPQLLPGTDGVRARPFWSPDSRSIAFFADDKLKRIDIAGGLVQTLANAPSLASGTWSGALMLFTMLGTPIMRVPDTGGTPVPVTRLERQQGSHTSPHFLPDGRRFLYWARGASGVGGVHVGDLETAQTRHLLDADEGAVYMSSGHVLFIRQRTLYAQGFDAARAELTGNPFPFAERVAAISASAAGALAYRSGARQ